MNNKSTELICIYIYLYSYIRCTTINTDIILRLELVSSIFFPFSLNVFSNQKTAAFSYTCVVTYESIYIMFVISVALFMWPSYRSSHRLSTTKRFFFLFSLSKRCAMVSHHVSPSPISSSKINNFIRVFFFCHKMPAILFFIKHQYSFRRFVSKSHEKNSRIYKFNARRLQFLICIIYK